VICDLELVIKTVAAKEHKERKKEHIFVFSAFFRGQLNVCQRASPVKSAIENQKPQMPRVGW
jgi:hypothetical protein